MKKILLTGSSGFIGRNLKEYLADKYLILAPTHKELDLCDSEQVEDYVRKNKADVVIHSANTNNTRNKNNTSHEVINNNLRMFYNLKRCSSHYSKLYYFGSGAEYDADHYKSLMEEGYFGKHVPKDAYGFSKYIMANSINDVNNIFDLRLFGVYGKYEEWERRFISNNICRALSNLPITINQNMYFDYLHIDDLGAVMEWFIENEPKYKHYNVCSGKVLDLYSIAAMIKKRMNSDCDIIIKESGLKKEYSGCNKRLRSECSSFRISDMEKNIDDLIGYYAEGGSVVNYAEGL